MARVKLTTEQAQELRSRPVAKQKGAVRRREAERELELNTPEPKVKVRRGEQPVVTVSAGEIRGIMNETLARAYAEIFSGMQTHDENENVDPAIQEEVYILTLTMFYGNDVDLPRTGLSIREDGNASKDMKSCAACQRKEDSNGG
jgi:hypothetical protein